MKAQTKVLKILESLSDRWASWLEDVDRIEITPIEEVYVTKHPLAKFYGCIDDETFIRHPQPEQSERESIDWRFRRLDQMSINEMTTTMINATLGLRDRLSEKLDDLEADTLPSVIEFVDFLLYKQQINRNRSKPKTMEDRTALVEDFRQLFKETQALHADRPLANEEIAEEIAAYRGGE